MRFSHETVLISTAECPVPLSNGFFYPRWRCAVTIIRCGVKAAEDIVEIISPHDNKSRTLLSGV